MEDVLVTAKGMIKDLTCCIIEIESLRGDLCRRLLIMGDNTRLEVKMLPGADDVKVEVIYALFLSGGAEAYWRKVLWHLNLLLLEAWEIFFGITQ